MSEQTGNLGQVGIGIQKVDDLTAAVQGDIIGLELESFDEGLRVTKENKEVMAGRIEKNAGADVTAIFAEPSFSGIASVEELPLLILAMLGDITTVANSPEAGVNTHTIVSSNDNTPPSLTLVYISNGFTNQIVGFRAGSLTIESVSENRVKFEVTGRGRYAEVSSLVVPYENKVNFSIGDSCADVAGSQVDFERFKVEFTRDIINVPTICNLQYKKFLSGPLELKGDGDLVFTEEGYRDNWAENDILAFVFNLIRTSVTIGASTNPRVSITVPEADLNEYSTDRALDSKVMSSFVLQAQKKPSITQMVSVVAVNEETY